MPKKYLSRVVLLLYALSSAYFLYDTHIASGVQARADFPPAHWRPRQPVSDTDFVGDGACAKCHTAMANRQRTTGMAQALEAVAKSRLLRAHPVLEAKIGPYSYRIERRGEQSVYTVTDGTSQISAPLLYAFGRGEAGQTYVLRYEGEFYESRVSFYNRTGGLDLTIGAQAATPRSLVEAMGRPMTKQSAVDCFSCHATATDQELQLDEMVPGVGCEACHGPGEKHVAAMTKGDGKEPHIFNPAKLSGDEITNEFCGACHRSVDTVVALPDRGGEGNVRFQPYRIFLSKCYSDDRRISCTACHDPHRPMETRPEFYDSKCMACHQPAASREGGARPATKEAGIPAAPHPAGTKQCATCHMPKVELPGAHFKFTDHRIRIVKPGEAYPK